MFKHLALAQLLLNLRSIWYGISKKNPITPAKIVRSLKLVYNFLTGNKLVLALLIGLGAAVWYETADSQPTQVLSEISIQAVPSEESSVLVPSSKFVDITAGGGNVYEVGRGTLIKPDLVVTCWHLFRDHQDGIVVHFQNGVTVKGDLFSVDKTHDLATVVLRKPVDYPYAQLSTSKDLNSLEIFDGKSTKFVKWNQPSVHTAEAATLVSSGGVPSGHSGGGLYNSGGLYGVIWGSADGETYATSGAKFRSFIDRTLKMRGTALVVTTDPDTCQPCARMMPTLEKLAEEGYFLIGIKPEGGERIPRLDFWRDGEIIKTIDGYADERTIRFYLEYPTYP